MGEEQKQKIEREPDGHIVAFVHVKGNEVVAECACGHKTAAAASETEAREAFATHEEENS